MRYILVQSLLLATMTLVLEVLHRVDGVLQKEVICDNVVEEPMN
jgi:hypothetical protein